MDIITVQTRNPAAKAKQLRRSGYIPCVIFGKELPESLPVQIDDKTAKKISRTMRNGSKAVLNVNGKVYHTLIKNLENNGITDDVIHISFQVLDKNDKYNSVADIMFLNTDKVAGTLEIIQRQVAHKAVPEHLIDTVTLDLENKQAGTVVTVGDIPEFHSEYIELLDNADNIVYRVRERKYAVGSAEQAQ